GSGTTSNIIKGVDWVTANAVKPAVANMSLSGNPSTTLDNAVKNSASKGIFYAIAAGNKHDSACNYSPARAGTANGVATVAATDSFDQEASFSNLGSWSEHSLHQERRRDDHHVGHLHGIASCRRRRGALPFDSPYRVAIYRRKRVENSRCDHHEEEQRWPHHQARIRGEFLSGRGEVGYWWSTACCGFN